MFSISVENEFDFGSQAYAELFAKSAATAFQHPIWLGALYHRLLTQNSAQPLIVVARNPDGALAMVLPMVKRRYSGLRAVEFASLRVSDYIAPVAAPEIFAQIVNDRQARRAIRKAFGSYDVLRVTKLRSDAGPVERLFGARPRQPMGTNAYATRLEASHEEWRAKNLTPSLSKELDKKSRRLHRRGAVRFACVEDLDEISEVFRLMKVYREVRFADESEAELLRIPAYYDFYRDIAAQAGTGFSRLYVTWVDDVPIAAQLGLAHNHAFLAILGGLDYENYKSVSLGMLMMQEIARDCIARGETELDFTIGDEPYKLDFGARAEPMWRFSQARNPLGYAALKLVETVRPLEALARNAFG